MAETSYIIQNGRRLNLKDASARKSIGSCDELETDVKHCLVHAINELNEKVKSGGGGGSGEKGDKGDPGEDGVSCTHEWNGTVLTVTSASGTSSADLKGDKGDKGERGPQGEKGNTPTVADLGIIDWFGAGAAIPQGSDLDTYTTDGKYYCSSTANSKTLLNCPVDNDNFVMFVFRRTSGNSLTQMIITLNGALYIRGTASNGSFRAWGEMARASAFQAHKDDVSNPHGVTAEQIGAVPNLNGECSDCNVAMSFGRYKVKASAQNAPTTARNGDILFVVPWDENTMFQMYAYGSSSAQKVFFRFSKTGDASTWYAWKEFIHTGNFSDYAVNKAGDTMNSGAAIQFPNTSSGSNTQVTNVGNGFIVRFYPNSSDGTNYTELKVENDTLYFNKRVNGTTTLRKVIHEGNIDQYASGGATIMTVAQIRAICT